MKPLGLNAAFAAGSNLAGVRFDPFSAFNFLVEIESILSGGFSEVSGLEMETEVEEYREGGLNTHLHQLPGPSKPSGRLILKHGMTFIDSLWSWHQDVVEGKIKRRNGTIFLLDAQRLPVVWWNFKRAWPVKWQGPEFRAADNAVAFETVELAHEGLSKPLASRALAVARLAV